MFRADLENVPGPPPGTPLPKSWPIYFSEQNYYFSNQHDFFGAPEAEGRRGLVSSDFYETLKLLISNTRYMTLGPKFYTKLVSAITRRRMHLNQWFRGESKKVRHSPSSDSVKSRFKALFKKCPSWIRRCCFSRIFAPGGRLNQGAYKRNYTSDPTNDIFEKVYTYDFWAQRHVFITKSTFFGSDKFKS